MFRYLVPFTLLLTSLLLTTSCYKDNEEALYEGYLAACDTTAISFSDDIKPILAISCDNCHSTATAPILGAGINLNDADKIAAFELQFPGRFYGSMAHVRPYSPMPKGSRKLDNCALSKIDAWVKAGTPNN